MQSATTSALDAHAFDPAQWVENFKTTGGWWVTRSDGIAAMGWRVDGFTASENYEARRLFNIVAADRVLLNAVSDLLVAHEREA